jgi:hypothetical protein
MRTLQGLSASLVLAAGGVAAQAAGFTTTFSVATSGTTGIPCSASGTNAPTIEICETEDNVFRPLLAVAYSLEGAGYIQLGASVRADAIPDSSIGSARAMGSFSDTLTLFAPGLANQTAVLTGAFVAQGRLSATSFATHVGDGAGISSARSTWSVTGGFLGAGIGGQGVMEDFSDGRVVHPSNVNGLVIPVVQSVSFDATGHATGSFDIFADVDAGASAFGFQRTSADPIESGSAGAGADFSQTMYWGGISTFTVNGASFTDYTITSASGADYRFSTAPGVAPPVPEPRSALLLLGGLGVVLANRRRARSA